MHLPKLQSMKLMKEIQIDIKEYQNQKKIKSNYRVTKTEHEIPPSFYIPI